MKTYKLPKIIILTYLSENFVELRIGVGDGNVFLIQSESGDHKALGGPLQVRLFISSTLL